MTNSAQSCLPWQGAVCSICGRSIALETSNTDERGKAVHEGCYVDQTISTFRIARSIEPLEIWLNGVCVRLQLSDPLTVASGEDAD